MSSAVVQEQTDEGGKTSPTTAAPSQPSSAASTPSETSAPEPADPPDSSAPSEAATNLGSNADSETDHFSDDRLAELERTLNDIDALLTDIEADLEAD